MFKQSTILILLGVIALCFANIEAQVKLNSGLVAFYPFNGNANDESGNGYNGIVSNVTLAADRFGNLNRSYDFNGSNSSIIVNNLATASTQLSLSVWYFERSVGTSGNRMMEHEWLFDDSYEGSFSTAVNGDSAEVVLNSPSGNFAHGFRCASSLLHWNHLALMYDGNKAIMYFNGNPVDSFIDSRGIAERIRTLYIGSRAQWAWDGLLDDIRIYNRALSPTDIDSLYHEGGWSTLNSGLVAYYPFNGNTNDESGNGNNATITGAKLTNDRFGNPNRAYSFDGIDNVVEVPTNNSFAGSGPRSVSLWFRSDTLHARQDLFSTGSCSQGTMFNLIYNGTNATSTAPEGLVFGGYHDDLFGNSNTVNRNIWNHVVFVYDGNSVVSISLNGLVDKSGLIPTPLNIGSSTIRFGKGQFCDNGYAFEGALDDIRLYNRELSNSEIDSLYHEGGWTGLKESLVLYYPFKGNANDESGNGNNGTVNGARLTADRFGNPNQAYYFNGVDNWIRASGSQMPSGPRSISIWYRIDDLTTHPELLAYGGDGTCGTSFCMAVNSVDVPNQYHMQSHCGVNLLTAPYPKNPEGSWHHWVATSDTNGSKFFVDGALITTNSIFINNTPTAGTDLALGVTVHFNGIGPWQSENLGYLKGALDDIRIYNRALSDTEISTLYHEGESTDTMTIWKIRMVASAGAVSDANNYLGVAGSATDGFNASYDIPEAPQPPGNYIQLYFSHPEFNQPTGDDFTNDIRAEHALGDTVIRWKFDVNTNISDTIVTLNFVSDGRIPTAYGMLLKDLTAGTRKNLKTEGMSYSYNSGAGGIRHFEMMIGDSTAPQIAVRKPNGGEIVRARQNYDLQWLAGDGTGVDSMVIFASDNAGTSYQPITTLHGLQTQYGWSVPSTYLNYQGSIKITVTDSMGNTATDISDHVFTTVGDSLAEHFTAGWNLIGTPLQPFDFSLSGTFGDNIGEPFYVYEYSPVTGYNRPDSLRQGKGYWLGLLHDYSVDVKGIAVQDSNVIALQQGFGIISNPLVVPLPTAALEFRKDGNIVSYDSAIANGWIATGIQSYDPQSHSYQAIDTMTLWKGGWIGTLQSGVELICAPSVSNIVPSPKARIRTATDWQVNVIASTGTSSDKSLSFGIKADATDGFDVRYDQPKPPAPPNGKYIEEYFNHPDWTPVLGSKFNTDIKSVQSLSWSFTINTTEQGTKSLSWDREKILSAVPDSIALHLTDVATGLTVDMRAANSYEFSSDGARQFTINGIALGINEENKLPKTFMLHQNYPNPFNPGTEIQYELSASAFVSLKVYNILGQEVATLVNGQQEAGYKTVQFNASKLTSGIYMYRIVAGTFTDVKKMTLMK